MLGKRKPSTYGSGPPKRRKRNAVEEISFDFAAREEYLTGFHKRKLQRIKNAQEQAAKQEREERIRERKRLREERQKELEGHVEAVNAVIREQAAILNPPEASEEWEGIDEGERRPEIVNQTDEYEDEDRFTTVTIEEVEVTKYGLETTGDNESDDEIHDGKEVEKAVEKSAPEDDGAGSKKKKWWASKEKVGPTKKKKKFKYESKVERKATRMKERSGNKRKAVARRE